MCGSFAQLMLVLWGRRCCCWLLHDGPVDDWLDVIASVSGVNYTLPLAVLQLLFSKDAIKTHVWCLRLDDDAHTRRKTNTEQQQQKFSFSASFKFLKQDTPVGICNWPPFSDLWLIAGILWLSVGAWPRQVLQFLRSQRGPKVSRWLDIR